MLQRALATLLCLLGIAAIGLGAASATLWRPADTLSASLRVADGAVVTDPGVLDLAAGSVTVTARAASGPAVLALGRSADVMAWVGEDRVTRVSGLASRSLLVGTAGTGTAASEPSATGTAGAGPTPSASPEASGAPASAGVSADPSASAPADGSSGSASAADPSGSDLWIQEASGTPSATFTWTAVPGRWSAIAVATAGGPVTIELTWPQVVTTPWRTPGLLVGALLLVAGLIWWGVLLLRRYRPDAVLGLVATAARRREPLAGASLPARQDTDRAPDGEVAEVRPGAGARSAHSSAAPTDQVGLVDAPPGGRRARRAAEAAAAMTGTPGASADADTAVGSSQGTPAAGVRGAEPSVGHRLPSPLGAPAESSPAPGTEPAPLTRRALREQRERAESERAGHAPQGTGPAAVPEDAARVVAPDPGAAMIGTPGPAALVEPGTTGPLGGRPDGTADVVDAAAAATPGGRRWSRVATGPVPATSPTSPESTGTRSPRGRLEFLRRRPAEVTIEPPEPAERAAEAEPAHGAPTPTPASSADAWRRAWGLPAAGSLWVPGGPGPDDPAAPPPTTPTEEER